MNVWKTGALAGALVLAASAGAAIAPAARAQSRDREPVARALQVIGRGAQIGVTVRDVEGDETKLGGGVIVDEVRQGSPADKAGLKRGDRIVELDGERVRSVAQFRRLVQETADGRAVNIAVQRDGQRVTASVTPERGSGGFYFGDDFLPMPPTPPSAPAAPAPPPAPAIPWSFDRDFGWMTFAGSEGLLGVSVESLGDQLATYFGVKDGVLVRTVREGSPAAAAGVKAGDVITSVNGQRIERPSDLASEIRRIGSGGEFTLEISRDRKTQTVKGKLGAREDRIRTRTRTIV